MKLLNSLSSKLEEFRPLHPKKVSIYICGITPYDTTHLGHAFTYISFDALIRFLKFKGFKVIYTQNVTDINDRDKDILERAQQQHTTWQNLTYCWTKEFLEDMKALNWIMPDYFWYASKHIESMIRLIKALIGKKLAYEVNGSVYLQVSKFPDYGRLSKINKKQMLQKAAEFDEDLQNPNKKAPLDITLWKATTPNQATHIPSFPSPFGPGRPGWHIECSSMSISSLGDQIDIHGGGIDLIFPHHEAEVVQSEGATGKKPFAKYWLHTGQVFYQGERMSKSKGNLVMVSKLLKKYSPNAIRWMLLSHQWNKQWEYKEEDLIKAQKGIEMVEKRISSSVIARSETTKQSSGFSHQFSQILDQNLNTSKALEFLLELSKENNPELKNLYQILGFKIS